MPVKLPIIDRLLRDMNARRNGTGRKGHDESSDDENNATGASNYWLALLYYWMGVIEYYAFLILGGCVWCFAAWKILVWHKFPFHQYLLEVGCIMLLPIVLLAIILTITDRAMKPKEE